jgi:hypothetical protein
MEQMPGKLGFGDQAYQKESRTMATRNEFDSVAVKRVKGRGKARQETIHARIKIFRVMEERFRHVRDN